MDDWTIPLIDTEPGKLVWVWPNASAGGTAHLAPFGLLTGSWNGDGPIQTMCNKPMTRADHDFWDSGSAKKYELCHSCIVELMTGPYGEKWFFRSFCKAKGGYHTTPHQRGCPFETCDYPVGYHVNPHKGCPLR